MVRNSKRRGSLTLRLLAVLCLLACPRIGATAGTWSVLSLPQQPGEVMSPALVAVDGAGSVYVADYGTGTPWSASTRIQKRDPQGHWSLIATYGTDLGQVDLPMALAADAAGNLYVLDYVHDGGNSYANRLQQRDAQGRWSLITQLVPYALAADAAGNLYVVGSFELGEQIWKRDAQGHWSEIATYGTGLGQVFRSMALTADAAGNLYVVDWSASENVPRLQRRDVHGNWSVLATQGSALVNANVRALAADAAGTLYVADDAGVERRDAQGHWSLITTLGDASGQVNYPTALAADAAGKLYVIDNQSFSVLKRLQQRDAQGHWSFLATRGEGPGQLVGPAALAVDRAGNLYVADQSSDLGRIQHRDPKGNWSVLAAQGASSLAVDSADNLYVVDQDDDYNYRIQQRDAQGHWSLIAAPGTALGQVYGPRALAVDAAGNLYVAEARDDDDPPMPTTSRIQQRDAQGHWSLIAGGGNDPGQVSAPRALTVDAAGNLYVAEGGIAFSYGGDPMNGSRIQRRDVQGHWSVVATDGDAPGEVANPQGLAVDSAGNLYVSDAGTIEVLFNLDTANRIQKRDVQGHWSFINQDEAVGQFELPGDLAVDGAGKLYVADNGNSRVLGYDPDSSPPPPPPMLTFSIGDRAGDQRGAIDVTGMVMTFEQKHGSYTIVLTADPAHPFTGQFRVDINVYNPSAPAEFSVFSDTLNDYGLGSATTTTLTLTGTDARLEGWQAGDRVSTHSFGFNHGPLGNPPDASWFRSTVADLPLTFLTDEDVIGVNDQSWNGLYMTDTSGAATIH